MVSGCYILELFFEFFYLYRLCEKVVESRPKKRLVPEKKIEKAAIEWNKPK